MNGDDNNNKRDKEKGKDREWSESVVEEREIEHKKDLAKIWYITVFPP